MLSLSGSLFAGPQGAKCKHCSVLQVSSVWPGVPRAGPAFEDNSPCIRNTRCHRGTP